jgi:hypothetical protein
MSECLAFWKRHLMEQGEDREEEEPNHRITWFQCRGEVKPGPIVKEWPGQWMQAEAASVGGQTTVYQVNGDGILVGGEEPQSNRQWKLPFSTENGEFADSFLLLVQTQRAAFL